MNPFMEAVADAAADVPRLYEANEVPSKPKYPYVVYSVTGDRAAARRLDYSHGLRHHRITWQAFGKTVDSAVDMDNLMTAALLDRFLVVPGYASGPCSDAQTVLGALVRDADADGVVGVTSSLLFTATPLES